MLILEVFLKLFIILDIDVIVLDDFVLIDFGILISKDKQYQEDDRKKKI